MSVANFQEINDGLLDDFENAPPAVPGGTWRLQAIGGNYHMGKIDKNGDEYSRLVIGLRAIDPVDGVDPEELERCDEYWQSAPLYASVFIRDKRDKYKAVKLLKMFGVETSGRTLTEAADLIKGSGFEIFGQVVVEYDDDGEPRNGDVKPSHAVD